MSFLQKLLNLIYPPKCPLCDAFVTELDSVCDICENSLHILDADANFPHFKKIWFTKCRSRFAFDGPIREALHGFKYGERLDLTRFLARELFEVISSLVSLSSPSALIGDPVSGKTDWIPAFAGMTTTLPPTVLLPVPLHVRRLRERGFNQSALIVKQLTKLTKIPCELDTLNRIRDIKPQVGLERSERLKNIKDAFAVDEKKAKNIANKNIILVDDVITTGATINECARVLIKSGASSVSVLSIARTL